MMIESTSVKVYRQEP